MLSAKVTLNQCRYVTHAPHFVKVTDNLSTLASMVSILCYGGLLQIPQQAGNNLCHIIYHSLYMIYKHLFMVKRKIILDTTVTIKYYQMSSN